MKINYRLGGILAIISAVMGIVGHFVLFLNWYVVGMSAPSAEPGCEILLKYIHPLMADFGILGGVFFAVAAYGFFARQNWALFLSAIGLVLALLGSWLPARRAAAVAGGCEPDDAGYADDGSGL